MFCLKYSFTFCFLLLSLLTFSQSSSLTVECSSDTIHLGNSIRVVYQMKNIDGQFFTPDFEAFEVSGPSVSSQYQNINGQESSQKSYTYILTPQKNGDLSVPGAEVLSDGETLRSEMINIFVKENPDGIIEEIPSNNGIFGEWSFDTPNKKEKVPATSKSKRKRRKI